MRDRKADHREGIGTMTKGALKPDVFCTRCLGNDWVRPSRLCWRDVLFLPIGFRPYRCLICFRCFHAFGRRWVWPRRPCSRPDTDERKVLPCFLKD